MIRLTNKVCFDSDSVLWTSLTECSCDDQSLLCIIREQGCFTAKSNLTKSLRIQSIVDPSMLEYERQLPITDSKQFSEFLQNSISEDGITFKGQNFIALPSSFYKVCFVLHVF